MIRLYTRSELIKWHDASSTFGAREYKAFLQSDKIFAPWVGVSLQHLDIDYMKSIVGQDSSNALMAYVQMLTNMLVPNFGGEEWMVQHENPMYPWLPSYLRMVPSIQPLYEFFNSNGINFMFDGGIQASFSDIEEVLSCLMQYPAFLGYQDINIFHQNWDIGIKIGHHFTVDLISHNSKSLTRMLEGLDLSTMKVVHYQ